MDQKMKSVYIVTIIVLCIFLVGCGSGKVPPGQVPQFSVRIMAYNIWLGAGVNPASTVQRGTNMDRLADLISLVKQANPDILGLEEVTDWTSGNPSIIEQFASEVSMDYYLAPTSRGIDNAIFSKYPILEVENLSEFVGYSGALRAVIQIPDGQALNVVVVHLDPIDQVLRSCQFDRIRRIMETYQDEPSILMGDTNSLPSDPETSYLTQGGWELVQSELIDNIFVMSRQAWSAKPMCIISNIPLPNCVLDTGISDHMPVGATISFYASPNSSGMPSSLTQTPIADCNEK